MAQEGVPETIHDLTRAGIKVGVCLYRYMYVYMYVLYTNIILGGGGAEVGYISIFLSS